MSAAAPLAAGLGIVLAATILLRISWGMNGRRALLNGAAWLLLAAGLVALARMEGAWGVAAGLLIVMLAAAGALIAAGLQTLSGGKPPRQSARAARRAPVAAAPAALGRRATWFLLTVPAAAAVSVIFALAGQGLARAGAWHPANSGALPFLIMPTVWALLGAALLMASKLRTGALFITGAGIAAAAVLLLTL